MEEKENNQNKKKGEEREKHEPFKAADWRKRSVL